MIRITKIVFEYMSLPQIGSNVPYLRRYEKRGPANIVELRTIALLQGFQLSGRVYVEYNTGRSTQFSEWKRFGELFDDISGPSTALEYSYTDMIASLEAEFGAKPVTEKKEDDKIVIEFEDPSTPGITYGLSPKFYKRNYDLK